MKKLLWIVFLAFLINENAYSKDSFKSKLTGKELDYLAQCRTEDNKIQMFGFNAYSTKEMKTNAPKTLKKYPLDYFGTFHQSGKGKNYAGAAYAVFTKNPDVWTWVSGVFGAGGGSFSIPSGSGSSGRTVFHISPWD